MSPVLRSVLLAPALVVALASAADAQVHRCGNTGVYTDRPCDDAKRVDVRPNILDAGPRTVVTAPEPPPAPAVIPPDPTPAQPASSSGNLFEQRDSRDSEFRNRTGPFQR